MQELAEQFLLRGQRHERVVWLAFKKRLDEGNGALRIVMPQPVEIHQHRMGATGLLFEAGGADLAPGAHQIVRRERLESRLDVLFAGGRGLVEAELLVAPIHGLGGSFWVLAAQGRGRKDLGKGLCRKQSLL